MCACARTSLIVCVGVGVGVPGPRWGRVRVRVSVCGCRLHAFVIDLGNSTILDSNRSVRCYMFRLDKTMSDPTREEKRE